ncbi:hypothetical protein CNYM01_10387 [Colletotrichum nymphaeae SA-01]|uniref:Uncharacterized protein n=1 Tax=Colletotrichum nymphaeae SA-01 TaxID=1460502 RepID=A0A135SB54_9PEZI|nr:hypothetical protein CNYM01_10387 [Colletotrichum nymphaeae SA-01]
MPSLSLLRRGSKAHDQRPSSPSKRQQRQQQEVRPPLSPPQENGREAPAGGLGIGTGEPERERKFSKRDLFGGLLSRSKGRSVSSSASTPASSTKSGRGPGAESPTKLPSDVPDVPGAEGWKMRKFLRIAARSYREDASNAAVLLGYKLACA